MNYAFVYRLSWLGRVALIFLAFLVCEAVGAQSASVPVDIYRVQFVTNDEARVSAQLVVRTGLLVMDGGSKPDARSVNVADFQAIAADGKPIIANYDPQHGSWVLAVLGTQRINLSYAVHLAGLRALPGWAHLQYGFFDGDAIYLVMSGLIVAPDSTESTDAATVSFSLPQGAKVAAPWKYDEGKQAYASTIAALVNNSIVAGRFSQVFYHEGNFSIAVVLLGEWSSHQALCQNCARIQRFHSIRVTFERKADSPVPIRTTC